VEMDRVATYAGSFYPEDQFGLAQMIDIFMQKAGELKSKNDCLGLISPHAGYVYSGGTAAYVYQHLKNRSIRNIFLIAPSHRGGQSSFSVSDYQNLETPLGKLKTNREVVDILRQHSDFSFNPYYDRQEHSLEVQLPFIYTVHPKAEIIPIIFNHQTYENAVLLAEILKPWIEKDMDQNVVLISSDFSHYHSAETARIMDFDAIDLICGLESEKLYEKLRKGSVEACGFGGILTLMTLAVQKGYKNVRLLNYSHSGMVSMDLNQVVGYSAIVFEKGEL